MAKFFIEKERDGSIMTDIEKEIILAYAENDMNATLTAKETFHHYQTVHYQLHNIREKYGLEPHNFYDLVELVKMAISESTEELKVCIHNEVCEYGKNPDKVRYCLGEKCKHFMERRE